MKAFAVLDGGGVKGAALAGALAAAEEKNIEFVGYGGTSAGSIVALLASVGYSGIEIHQRLQNDIHPLKLLDDDGQLYRSAAVAVQEAIAIIKDRKIGWCGRTALGFMKRHRELLQTLGTDLGIYDGARLMMTLKQLISEKIPEIEGYDDPTFANLEEHGAKQLKIVASDIFKRRAVVFEKNNEHLSQSVLKAVRASSSYPFFFKPVDSPGGKRFVDGGLSSNLPVFLFEKEHEKTQLPIIALDLVSGDRKHVPGVMSFIQEIADTAFEASDELLGEMLPGLKHIRIKVPANIGTLKFDLTADEIESMFQAGRSDASAALNEWDLLTVTTKAGEEIQKELKAYYGPERLFEPVLRSLIQEIGVESKARDLRANIMVPTGRSDGSRIVVYRHGYRTDDPDIALELAEFGGCSGQASKSHSPVVANLEKAAENFNAEGNEWNMTQFQQNQVAKDRKSMLSVPVFARERRDGESAEHVPVRAILSIDSSTALHDSGWLEISENESPFVTKRVTDLAIQWSAVVSKLLS